MKRFIYSILFLTFILVWAFPQQTRSSSDVSDSEFQSVLNAVSNEDWDSAVALSSKFMKRMKSTDDRLPRLRYICLYSAAGKVSEGRMEFDEFHELAKEFIGKYFVLPYRPITAECKGALNFICQSRGSNNRLMVGAANKSGTSIFAFEYVELKDSFDFASHENEQASIAGTVQAINPNPNKSRAIVMRLYISDAVIRLKESPQRSKVSAN